MDRPLKNRHLSQIKKDIVVTKIAAGQSVASIAREQNVSARHIHDYLMTSEGFERLESSVRDAREILETRLPSLITKALDVLEACLDAPYMSDAKMNAAKTVVRTVSRLSETKKSCADDRIVN